VNSIRKTPYSSSGTGNLALALALNIIRGCANSFSS
jgi:hypothetical protein